jgi:hypothetical protein
MNVEALCKSIVDCIISLRYDLMFECDLDMDKARERSLRYYAELTKMHASDPQGFADAVLSVLPEKDYECGASALARKLDAKRIYDEYVSIFDIRY